MRLSRELTRSLLQPVSVLRSLETCWFPVAVGLYLLLAAGLRTLVAKSLMFDESEQLALSQVLALGYGSQPPLVVWIVWCVTTLFGPSMAAIVAVRFAILGLLYCGLYSCGRALTANHSRAALAAAGAVFVPAVSWDFVLDKTNTPLACAIAALTVASLVNAVRTNHFRAALHVGVLVALGVLSKYTFIPFAAALFFASLTVSRYREWMVSRHGAGAIALAVLLLLPHLAWVIASRGELTSGFSQAITNRPDRVLSLLFVSAGDVALMSCGFTLAVFAILVPQVFHRNLETTAEARLLGRTLLLAGITSMVVVVVAGGNRFKPHWFTPMAVLLPTFLVTRLESFSIPRGRVIGLWGVISATVLIISLAMCVLATTNLFLQGRQLHARDHLADEMRIALTERPDSIICDALRDAGNLRLAYPETSVVVLSTPLASRPVVQGSVVFVWDASREDAIHESTRSLLIRDYGLRPDPRANVRYIGERLSADNPLGRRLGVIRLVPNDVVR